VIIACRVLGFIIILSIPYLGFRYYFSFFLVFKVFGMINSEAIMEMGETCIRLMIFASANDGVDGETIRGFFVNSRKVYRQFIVNYATN